VVLIGTVSEESAAEFGFKQAEKRGVVSLLDIRLPSRHIAAHEYTFLPHTRSIALNRAESGLKKYIFEIKKSP
jgi:hypothetical protein